MKRLRSDVSAPNNKKRYSSWSYSVKYANYKGTAFLRDNHGKLSTAIVARLLHVIDASCRLYVYLVVFLISICT
jgi:hypothetical protein